MTHDGRRGRRKVSAGATEGNTPAGRRAVPGRVADRFEEVAAGGNSPCRDAFEAERRVALGDTDVTCLAGEPGRSSPPGTDTEAKGMAYGAITSTALEARAGSP